MNCVFPRSASAPVEIQNGQSGCNFSEIELMQYRCWVGGGPSGKTCPRWASHRLQSTSTRTIPWLWSLSRRTASSATACQKLGQPDPDSKFSVDSNKALPQHVQVEVPGVLQSLYSPLIGGAVSFSRQIRYCSGVSSFRQVSSVLSHRSPGCVISGFSQGDVRLFRASATRCSQACRAICISSRNQGSSSRRSAWGPSTSACSGLG